MIERKVANARALDYPGERLEVVVASDGSTDRTAELARAAGADQVLELPRGGKVAALNAAVGAGEGAILAFSDANSYWRPDALRRLVDRFARSAGRLRVWAGPLRGRRGGQPGGPLLALRDGGALHGDAARRDHRRERRDLRGPPRGLHRARPEPRPGHRLPLRAHQAGLARRLRAGGGRRGEDGADGRGRVPPQAPDDVGPLGRDAALGDARPARLRPRSTRSRSTHTGCSAT